MNIYCYNLVIFAISGEANSVYSQHLNNEEKMEKLENEKNKLHREIEVAIDDGLRALHQEAGGGGAGAGVGERYLAALKLHLKQATDGGPASNSSSDGGPASNGRGGGAVGDGSRGEVARNVTGLRLAQRGVSHNTAVSNNTTNATSLRRFVNKKKKKRGPDELDEIFIYKDVFDKKDIEPEKGKLMLDNRFKLEKRLFEWMVKRQEEKKRLKEYVEKKRAHLLEVVTEKCPRFGYGKRTTKKKTRRSDSMDSVDAHRKEHRSRPKYPCCRKCCKKSYLGCL